MLRTILVFSLSTILSGFAVSASALDNGSSRYRSWVATRTACASSSPN